MNCSHCGHEVRGMFCTHCGTRVASPPPASSSGLGQWGDPDSTSVINHRELKEMLARVAQEAQTPAVAARIAPPTLSIVAEEVPAPKPAVEEESSWTFPEFSLAPEPEPASSALVTFEQASVSVAGEGAVDTRAEPAGFVPQGYPVQVSFDLARSNNRFFAVPLLGFLAKTIMLVPHVVLLSLLGAGAALAQLVLWAPVLVKGQYPAWGEKFIGGTLRWSARVQAYHFGLTDQYPPFSFGSNDDASYPVQVRFDVPSLSGRFWAVPLVGMLAKLIMLVPHLVVLYALGIVVLLLNLVTWAPVLFKGQYPEWGYSLVGGYLRWYTRVSAFLFGLNDQYPPFQLGG